MPVDRPRVFSRRTLGAQGLVAAAALVVGTEAAAGAHSPTGLNLTNAAVNLRVDPATPTVVRGTVGGRHATMTGTYFGSTVAGLLDGVTFTARVAQKDQIAHGTGYVTTTRLTGSMGGVATSLRGVFTLDAQFGFVGGVITGTHHGHRVRVVVTPKNSSGSSGYAAAVKGTYGSTPFSVVADLPPQGTGTVTGTVGGKRIRLRRTQLGVSGTPPQAQLTGTYSGPADLLALIVGTVSYFGG